MDRRKVAIEALNLITSIENCAPTEFSFGWVDKNNICKDGLIIKQCAPIVINKLIEHGYVLSMTANGLFVENFK